jgi:hypothetical protein
MALKRRAFRLCGTRLTLRADCDGAEPRSCRIWEKQVALHLRALGWRSIVPAPAQRVDRVAAAP